MTDTTRPPEAQNETIEIHPTDLDVGDEISVEFDDGDTRLVEVYRVHDNHDHYCVTITYVSGSTRLFYDDGWSGAQTTGRVERVRRAEEDTHDLRDELDAELDKMDDDELEDVLALIERIND